MLLQKDMLRAHQYRTGWAVETRAEPCERGDHVSQHWNPAGTVLLLGPYKFPFVLGFHNNSKNDHLFGIWHIHWFISVWNRRRTGGQGREGQKLEHLKSLHAPVNATSYRI